MRFTKLLLASVAFFAVTACASSQKGSTSNAVPTVLTAEEIGKTNVPTAFEAVERLRRRWYRDIQNIGEISVYMDNQKKGSKEFLKTIPAQDVIQLEYMSGPQAMQRFGQEAQGGAIIITRR